MFWALLIGESKLVPLSLSKITGGRVRGGVCAFKKVSPKQLRFLKMFYSPNLLMLTVFPQKSEFKKGE